MIVELKSKVSVVNDTTGKENYNYRVYLLFHPDRPDMKDYSKLLLTEVRDDSLVRAWMDAFLQEVYPWVHPARIKIEYVESVAEFAVNKASK